MNRVIAPYVDVMIGNEEDLSAALGYGEGAQRGRLEGLVRQFSLEGRVHFPGRVTNAFSWLRRADLFVMSSRFEGLPCALCEAMACGVPAISFDCDSGPREIIRHDVDGLLVPPGDVPALAKAMDRLMSNSRERARLAARAPEITERYSLEEILQRWNRLFARVLSQPRPARMPVVGLTNTTEQRKGRKCDFAHKI